jgi:hypothetical protein
MNITHTINKIGNKIIEKILYLKASLKFNFNKASTDLVNPHPGQYTPKHLLITQGIPIL